MLSAPGIRCDFSCCAIAEAASVATPVTPGCASSTALRLDGAQRAALDLAVDLLSARRDGVDDDGQVVARRLAGALLVPDRVDEIGLASGGHAEGQHSGLAVRRLPEGQIERVRARAVRHRS